MQNLITPLVKLSLKYDWWGPKFWQIIYKYVISMFLNIYDTVIRIVWGPWAVGTHYRKMVHWQLKLLYYI